MQHCTVWSSTRNLSFTLFRTKNCLPNVASELKLVLVPEPSKKKINFPLHVRLYLLEVDMLLAVFYPTVSSLLSNSGRNTSDSVVKCLTVTEQLKFNPSQDGSYWHINHMSVKSVFKTRDSFSLLAWQSCFMLLFCSFLTDKIKTLCYM